MMYILLKRSNDQEVLLSGPARNLQPTEGRTELFQDTKAARPLVGPGSDDDKRTDLRLSVEEMPRTRDKEQPSCDQLGVLASSVTSGAATIRKMTSDVESEWFSQQVTLGHRPPPRISHLLRISSSQDLLGAVVGDRRKASGMFQKVHQPRVGCSLGLYVS